MDANRFRAVNLISDPIHGYIELTNTASSFGNAGDYLGEIAVSNLSFS